MAQKKVMFACLFFSVFFSHIIQSIEGRHMRFEHINNISKPHSHTMASKRETGRVKNYCENSNVYATKKETFDNEPELGTPMASTPPSPEPLVSRPSTPGQVDGFRRSGPGHSPGIGHSIQN
uniref:Uncharacterized protein LOC104248848 n=1 Tax=Nicotiana sylvestris TaxID=4096 RepID=A0A1U7YWC2_NICSY|nr:PREDICTED: uncharacterized protein LOC104248848 [Nicotiana sylvestris]